MHKRGICGRSVCALTLRFVGPPSLLLQYSSNIAPIRLELGLKRYGRGSEKKKGKRVDVVSGVTVKAHKSGCEKKGGSSLGQISLLCSVL